MRTQKSPGAKAPKGETCKVNITLSVEAYRRLFVTSVMGGQTASAIVEGLISEGLRQWSLPSNLAARATSRQINHSADLSAHGEVPMADLAA